MSPNYPSPLSYSILLDLCLSLRFMIGVARPAKGQHLDYLALCLCFQVSEEIMWLRSLFLVAKNVRSTLKS